MKRTITLTGTAALIIFCFGIALSFAGGYGDYRRGPELDHTLMGMKEQGVWYFPCVAPQYPVKIGPSYVSYGPPPPCAPIPGPPVAPKIMK
jgi:hypothetical protein